MQQRNCEYCGRLMNQYDSYGNEVWNCPNDCDFENACHEFSKEMENSMAETIEFDDGPPIDHSLSAPSEAEIAYIDYVNSEYVDPLNNEANTIQNTSNFSCQHEFSESSKNDFEGLKQKYNVQFYTNPDPRSPLCLILFNLDEGNEIDSDSIKWLIENNFHNLLATIHYNNYLKNGNLWVLATACKSYRRCRNPNRVIEITEKVNRSNDKSYGAILTTRGGAYRDLKNYVSALKCAFEAIKINASSPHPYNLLGGIFFDKGNYIQGLEYFAKAQKFGFKAYFIDNQIKASFNKEHVDKNKLAGILFRYDPSRFNWVSNHLNSAKGQNMRLGV